MRIQTLTFLSQFFLNQQNIKHGRTYVFYQRGVGSIQRGRWGTLTINNILKYNFISYVGLNFLTNNLIYRRCNFFSSFHHLVWIKIYRPLSYPLRFLCIHQRSTPELAATPLETPSRPSPQFLIWIF